MSGEPKQASKSKTRINATNAVENTDCPIFLRKTYHMIDTCDPTVAGWSEDGASFLVRNVQVLASKFLPQYFKHNQFSSFVRQLNFYGFRKEKNDFVRVVDSNSGDDRRWHFRHEHFVKGRPELLSKITRRIPNKNKNAIRKGAAHDSNQTKNDNNGYQLDQENKKEVHKLKTEIASLESQLNKMANNMDLLSKTLNLKLNMNSGSGKSTKKLKGQDEINKASNDVNENQDKKMKTTATNQLKQTMSPKLPLPQKISSSTVPKLQSINTIASKHAASIDLPDLSIATDKDLQMGDATISLSRSSSIARTIDEGRKDISTTSILHSTDNSTACSIVEVDEIYASIENDLNSNMHYSSKEEDMNPTDIQPLPAFVPSFVSSSKNHTRQQNKKNPVIQGKHEVDQILQHLSATQRKEFVNKVLIDAAPDMPDLTSLYSKESFDINDLISALERILSPHDELKKEMLTNNGYNLNDGNTSKSSVVKIEF